MQTAYNQKLTEATKDAIQAFETNTVEWNEEYSETGDSKRRDVMAAMNTFVNSFANNLGMAGASKEELLPYIPAIAYIGYDGYYIYAPSEEPITVLNENEVTVLLNEKLVKVGGTPEDRTPICIKNFPPSPEAVEYIEGIRYNNADKVEKYEGSILYEWEDDASKNIHLNGKDGEYLYIKKDKNGTEIERKIISFTLNPEYAKKEYKHILKQYMPYSARYDNGKSGTQKIDITVNYTLDNYVTISGIVNGKYVKKSGYFHHAYCVQDRFPYYDPNIKVVCTDYIRELSRNLHPPATDYYIEPELLYEKVWYKGLVSPKVYNYIYDENNTKVYIDNDLGETLFQVSNSSERVNLEDFKDIKYKKLYMYRYSGYPPVECRQALNGSNKGKWYFRWRGDETYFDWPEAEAALSSNIKLEYSAINQHIESADFSSWIRKNIGGIEVDDMKVNNLTTEEFNERFLVEGEIFTTSSVEVPEDENSVFMLHRKEVIRESIVSGLNQAITSYSRNSQGEYKLPILSETEWDQLLRNVSILTFIQGIPIGLKTYNNYAIASSTFNKEQVNIEEIYLTWTDDFNGSRTGQYHKLYCRCLNGTTGIVGYRNIDFIAKTYKDSTNQTKYYFSRDITADAAIRPCYECIVQRSLYVENGAINETKAQFTAYLNAIARELYVSHEILNYEFSL